MSARSYKVGTLGRRRGYEDIPKSIKDLIDDPFRSLAGQLRRVGGFAKDTVPPISCAGG
jgi:hypothetical protein